MKLKLLCFHLILWHILPALIKPNMDVEEWEIPLKLHDGPNMVDNYNVHDQCQPIPGYPMAYFHQLAFKIAKNAYCDGKSFLLCYIGQTGKTNTNQGLVTPVHYRMKNLNNNPVTGRCRIKQQECLGNATCQKWAKDEHDGEDWQMPQWHGLLLTVDHQNVYIQLSTTNRVFVVPRNKFDEILTIKLASSKHGGISFLSNNIGPLREPGNSNDHQELVEKRGRIHVPEDSKLWKDYDKGRHSGMHLRRRVGIWSLGLDMLPIEDVEQIKLMVERSKCCKIDAWFMLPTSQPPTMESPPVELWSLNNSAVRIGKDMSMTLEGRFMDNDLDEVNFVLENRFQDDSLGSKFYAARIRVNFTDGSDIGNVTLQQRSTKWPHKWTTTHHFHWLNFYRGGHFNIEVYFREREFIVGLNCHKDENKTKFQYLEPMIHEDLYELRITDEHDKLAKDTVQLLDFNIENPKNLRSWNDTVERGSGVLFTGKMTERGKDFTICLRGIDGPKLFLCLYVDNAKEKYIMRSDFYHEDDKEVHFNDKDRKIGIHVGKPAQLYIQFTPDGDKLRIYMAPNEMGEEKWELVKELALAVDHLSKEDRTIDFVQLLGNFEKDGGFYPPYMPPALPYKEGFNYTTLGQTYQIVGVILPIDGPVDAKKSMLELTCTNAKHEPKILLQLQFLYSDTIISRKSSSGARDFTENVGKHPLAIGKKFVLRIRFYEDWDVDRNWHYELVFNNDKSTRVKVMDEDVDKIRDIQISGELLLVDQPGFI